MEDFLHVNPRRLLTPEDTLNKSDKNQKRLTVPLSESDASDGNGA